MILLPIPAAAEIRFEPPVTASQAGRWEALASSSWREWEKRFSTTVDRPNLVVGVRDVAELSGHFGRSLAGRIEFGSLVPAERADAVFRHELAHVFLEARCPGLAGRSPFVSEAFALFVSDDAAARAAEDSRFVGTSAARDWLLARGESPRVDEPVAVAALSRVLSRPERRTEWEAHFLRLVSACRDDDFAASAATIAFLDRLRARPGAEVSSRIDFVLVDGSSQEILASEGRPSERFPSGSILKPSLVAAVPELMEPRPAGRSPFWRCPDPAPPGERWTWQRALTRSCNGFFLDAPFPEESYAPWYEEMSRLGFVDLPKDAEGRIGIRTGFRISPVEVVRLYEWTDRKAPFVIDALSKTPVDGTLSHAAAAEWFVTRGIGLKSGTVRDDAGSPLHAWIVAIGPRRDNGDRSFFAAIHATGIAPAGLLEGFRRRLSDSSVDVEPVARVQILGLVPPGNVALSCANEAPLFVHASGETWNAEPPGSLRRGDSLPSGSRYACGAAPLVVSFPDSSGRPRKRKYFGTLSVERLPSAPATSSVPLREKSARARSGSRLVLETSESLYVRSSLLSEHAGADSEVMKALALVIRNNLRASRHEGRPVCDTTHCQLFGQDEGASAADRARARRAVADVASLDLASDASERLWLPFELGGSQPWSRRKTSAEIGAALGTSAAPTAIRPNGDGSLTIEPSSQHFPCEVVRNQLRLPSCPDKILDAEGGFQFHGHGEGHGLGLDLTRARTRSASGEGFRGILGAAYSSIRVVGRERHFGERATGAAAP